MINQHIRMISAGPCDTEDWSNGLFSLHSLSRRTQGKTLFYMSGPEWSSQSCGCECVGVLGDQSVRGHLPDEKKQTNKFKLPGLVLFRCDLIPVSRPVNVCSDCCVQERWACSTLRAHRRVFPSHCCPAHVKQAVCSSLSQLRLGSLLYSCVCIHYDVCFSASCDLCAVHAAQFSLFWKPRHCTHTHWLKAEWCIEYIFLINLHNLLVPYLVQHYCHYFSFFCITVG